MNIVDASHEASRNENSDLAFQILDQLNNQLEDPYLFVFFNSIDQVGRARHSWAWDVVENWQNN